MHPALMPLRTVSAVLVLMGVAGVAGCGGASTVDAAPASASPPAAVANASPTPETGLPSPDPRVTDTWTDPKVVSRNAAGERLNGDSGGRGGAEVSADGSTIAFSSSADNAGGNPRSNVADGAPADGHLYVKNLRTGTLTRVAAGASQPSLSADGGTLAYGVDDEIWVDELDGSAPRRIARGFYPDLSPDGLAVVFQSTEALVPEDSNKVDDVYLRDLRSGATTRVSVDAAGGQVTLPPEEDVAYIDDPGDVTHHLSSEPEFVASGTAVMFLSLSDDLVPGDDNRVQDVFVKTLGDGKVQRLAAPDNRWVWHASGSDSRAIALSSYGGEGVYHVSVTQIGPGEVTSTTVLTKSGSPGVLSRDGSVVAYVTNTPRSSSTRTPCVLVRRLAESRPAVITCAERFLSFWGTPRPTADGRQVFWTYGEPMTDDPATSLAVYTSRMETE